MRTISDVVRGALKLNGLPDRLCFTSWKDFILSLPDLLSVEVPASASNVIVGNEYPTTDDINKIWYRRDPSGNFIGIYAFQNGQWRLLYNYAPNEIIWMYGNSAVIPEGFVLIEQGDAVIISTVVNALRSQYVPLVGGGFAYFAVRFAGY